MNYNNIEPKRVTPNHYYVLATCIALMLTLSLANAQNSDSLNRKKLEGRWDITITQNEREAPSWLEITHSGVRTLVGHFVGPGGSARPISEIKVNGDAFTFEIPPQWEREDRYLSLQGKIDGEGLSGEITFPNGKTYPFKATRAPLLRRDGSVKWGKSIALIEKNSIQGWSALGNNNQWTVENGILKSPKSGANLVTEKKFNDFKLHVEFRYPKGSNSGVYLRGRYEVQIMDSKGNLPLFGELGGIYGFIAPAEQVAREPGEWQTYDITLIGRMVSVVANGKPIITNVEIPGITGGALDSKEGEPGPILLQGDHGPVEFRNMMITPAE